MFDAEDIKTCKDEARKYRKYIKFMERSGDNAAFVRVLLLYIEDLEKEIQKIRELKEENRKLKQKLSLHKKVLCVEQTMLKLIKEGQGSYENIAKVIYGQEVNNYNLVAIRTVISRLRKKGYNIQNVENWGYKEVTND